MQPTPAPHRRITVARVIDGDTIVTDTGERVRLLGVDTPELGRGDTPPECGARQAADALTRLLAGDRPAVLVEDPHTTATDRYGRTLGYLEVDGVDVGARLVADGWATVWTPTGAARPLRHTEYHLRGWAARLAGRGLWAACTDERGGRW